MAQRKAQAMIRCPLPLGVNSILTQAFAWSMGQKAVESGLDIHKNGIMIGCVSFDHGSVRVRASAHEIPAVVFQDVRGSLKRDL